MENTIIKCDFEVLILYLSNSILCKVVLVFFTHYILFLNVVSYFTDSYYQYKISTYTYTYFE